MGLESTGFSIGVETVIAVLISKKYLCTKNEH